MPPFSALLADAPGEELSDAGPVFGLLLRHQLQYEEVFSRGPGPLDQVGVEHLLPPVETLHIGAPRQRLSHFLPVLATLLLDSFCEVDIFILSPVALTRPILVLSRADLVATSLIKHALLEDLMVLLNVILRVLRHALLVERHVGHSLRPLSEYLAIAQ